MSTAPQQPVIHINNGKQSRVWLTITLCVASTVAGWIVNSDSVMPNLISFYTRLRYGRELAEQMKVKTPEQARLEALEAQVAIDGQARAKQAEADAAHRKMIEDNRLAQDKIIEGMRRQSAEKLAAEKQRADESQAELRRLQVQRDKIEADKPKDDKERLIQSGLDDNDKRVVEIRRNIKELQAVLPRLEARKKDIEEHPTHGNAFNAGHNIFIVKMRIEDLEKELRILQEKADEKFLENTR